MSPEEVKQHRYERSDLKRYLTCYLETIKITDTTKINNLNRMLPDGAFHEQNEKIQKQILEMNLTWLKNPPPFFSTSMYCPFYFRRYKSKD